MGKIILFAILLLTNFNTFKSEQINTENNGLIYNETTIKNLRFLVDSVNQQFKSCEINKKYYAVKQAKCFMIEINQYDKENAIKEILNNVSLEELSLKYKDLKIESDLIFTKHFDQNDNDENKIYLTNILNLKYNNSFELEINDITENDLVKNTWLPLDDISKDRLQYKANINLLYFTTNFETIPLPYKYNKYVQYANCVIDTNFTLYEKDAKFIDEEELQSEIVNFLDNFKQIKNVNELLKEDIKYKELLDEAIKTVLDKGISNDEFEKFLISNNMKDIALKLKRKRYVMGYCSQDEGPIKHNFEIAKLSAETYNWNIFLRAHLNILNDNFARYSDNSNAQKSRGTYIKELEVLNINTIDLLLGICLKVSNKSLNQFIGQTSRVAKALTESNFQEEFQLKVFEMINDNNLDDLNRIEMLVLYCSFINQTNEKDKKIERIKKLKENTVGLSANYQVFLNHIYKKMGL